MSDVIVIDTPQGIEAYVLLSVYHTLKMEVDNPMMKWRCNPAQQARNIMEAAGYDTPKLRTRKKTLEAFKIFLKDVKGIEVEKP